MAALSKVTFSGDLIRKASSVAWELGRKNDAFVDEARSLHSRLFGGDGSDFSTEFARKIEEKAAIDDGGEDGLRGVEANLEDAQNEVFERALLAKAKLEAKKLKQKYSIHPRKLVKRSNPYDEIVSFEDIKSEMLRSQGEDLQQLRTAAKEDFVTMQWARFKNYAARGAGAAAVVAGGYAICNAVDVKECPLPFEKKAVRDESQLLCLSQCLPANADAVALGEETPLYQDQTDLWDPTTPYCTAGDVAAAPIGSDALSVCQEKCEADCADFDAASAEEAAAAMVEEGYGEMFEYYDESGQTEDTMKDKVEDYIANPEGSGIGIDPLVIGILIAGVLAVVFMSTR